MSISFDLKADLRTKIGSAESRRLRKSGNIPAIIYGGENVQLTIPTKEFEKEYFKGDIFTTIINLDIDGKKQKVIVNKVDTDAVSDRPSHICFTKADKKVKAKVKVVFFNREKSPGIRKGGFLHVVTRKIELLCDADAIPQEIKVNIGKMRVGHKIRSTDLELPENVSFADKKEFNVASILGRGAKEEEEVATAESEAGEEASGEENAENSDNKEEKK